MTSTIACFRCGTPVPAGARFCMSCGSDVSGSQGQRATVLAPTDPPATPEALLEALRQATLGEYEILAELGRGGMATVFLAHDLALNRKVAIKVMSPSLVLMGPDMVERFKREARTAAALSHPHIIPIHAVRQSGQLLFFVMKFVPGRSLDSIIRELGQVPITMVQAILAEVGAALAYAHRQGVIHRDVKPANIMVDDEGWAVMTDFGIAKASDARGLTMTGVTVGTPTYMSPEQCAAKDVTGASDQYSLGIVAYEMLTGRPPFHSDTMMGVMYSHFNDTPRPIQELRPDCPPAMAAAVARMLAKAPAERFPSLKEALAPLGEQAAKPDETVRSRMVKLAQTGEARKIMAEVATPVSPVPAGRATPTVPVAPIPPPSVTPPAGPPAVVRPKATEPDAGKREPPIPPAAPPRETRRWPLFVGAGLAALLVGVLMLKPWESGADLENRPRPFPDDTTSGVHRDTAIPRAKPPKGGGEIPRPAPAPSARPVVTRPADLTAAQAAQTAANQVRDRAAASGASQATLWPGDSAYGVGTTFLDESQFAEAVAAFEAASQLWSGKALPAGGGEPASGPTQTPAPTSAFPTGTPQAPAAPQGQGIHADQAVQEEVREFFEDWGDAVEMGDVDRLRQLWPTMTAQAERSWRRVLEDPAIADLTASYEVLDVTPVGRTVEARVREVIVVERTGAPRTSSRVVRVRLRKNGEEWRIVSFGQ